MDSSFSSERQSPPAAAAEPAAHTDGTPTPQPLGATPCSLSSFEPTDADIPDDLVLGHVKQGDRVVIAYISPHLAEPERKEARRSWMEDAENTGGVAAKIRSSGLLGDPCHATAHGAGSGCLGLLSEGLKGSEQRCDSLGYPGDA